MAPVRFQVRHSFDVPARSVWDALVDWKHHEEWVPMTRVELGAGEPGAVGSQFTVWTGVGPLSLEDRMEVVHCDWHDDTQSGDCEVGKLGPLLRGRAGFTVETVDTGAELVWFEDVRVPYTPRFLGPLVGRVGAAGFRLGMRRLATLLSARA